MWLAFCFFASHILCLPKPKSYKKQTQEARFDGIICEFLENTLGAQRKVCIIKETRIHKGTGFLFFLALFGFLKEYAMSKIIRKIKKVSDTQVDAYTVRQAVGWQVHVRSNMLWSPPTDMYETNDAYIVRVEIAGMSEADFTVSVEGSFLVIIGSRPDVQEHGAYHQMEIRCGRFSSAVSLPNPIDLENASATYEDGFFIVTLPKLKPGQIEIKKE